MLLVLGFAVPLQVDLTGLHFHHGGVGAPALSQLKLATATTTTNDDDDRHLKLF